MMQLILNANMYAPEALGLGHILVAGGKIVWIGSDVPELDASLQVQVLDVAGAVMVPGLIDGHAHITGGGGESGPASRVPPVPLSHFTGAGVTSVVGVLGTDDLTRNTLTLVTQVYGLRQEGLSAWCYTGGYHLPLTTLTGSARGDIVFIDPIIGVGELALSDHRSSQPTLDEFLRVASETHVAGLMTGKAGIVHCHLGDGKRGLQMIRDAIAGSEIPARVFHPTHVNRNKDLFAEALALPALGCFVDVTAFPAADIGPGYSAAEAFVRYRDSGNRMDRLTISSDGGGCLPAFDEAGELVQMGIGSPQTLIETIQELAKNGLPLDEIVPAFTSNVAGLLKLPAKGKLQKGWDADLLVLDDQFEIQHVMAGGRWHVTDKKIVVHGTYENNKG
jgi:beta-aspartyl-dipeptidase (metallo-type)